MHIISIPTRRIEVGPNTPQSSVTLDIRSGDGPVGDWSCSDLPPAIARQLAVELLSAANEVDPPAPEQAEDWQPPYLRATEDETAAALREVASAVRELADAKRYSEEGRRARLATREAGRLYPTRYPR